MFENLATLAVASQLFFGTFVNPFGMSSPQIISPIPAHQAQMELKKKPESILTPSETPTFTASPTPSPTETPVTSTPTPTSIPTPTRPEPTPTTSQAPVQAVTGSELDNFFTIYSGQYGVDRELLRKIALCESSFNTNASYLGYGGMYQFAESSWISTRMSMGQNTDPALRFNAEEAIKTAAYKLAQPNGAASWPSCK